MAKRRRSSRRSSPRKRRRRFNPFARFMRRRSRRRSSSSSSAPRRGRRRRGLFRARGGFVRSVTSSAVPVVKTAIPIVAGAVAAAVVAKVLKGKFPQLAASPVQTGLAVGAVGLAAGVLAKRFAPSMARPIQLAAVGVVADATMRVLANARAQGRLTAALNTGREGLLADVPRYQALPPGPTPYAYASSADAIAAIA